MTATALHSFHCPRSNQPGCVAGQRVRVVRRFSVRSMKGGADANASFRSPGSEREAGSSCVPTGGTQRVLIQPEAAEVPDVQAADSREEPRRGQPPQGCEVGTGLVTTGERVAVADPESGEVLAWQVPVEWLEVQA